jgi:two-component system KDP operon response regulator KdpE
MTKSRVLVVDDDSHIRRALRVALTAAGYDVGEGADGQQALTSLATQRVDVVLLDLGLPRLDGVEVLRRLRTFSDVPVIVVSARHDHDEKIRALDLGADDYVTKPFDIGELLARLRALLRRVEPEAAAPSTVALEKGEVDLVAHEVRINGKAVHLTRLEFALLAELVTHPRQLLTHRWLLGRVWGEGYAGETHYLHVYMNRLRAKIEADPENPRHLRAERGSGYRFEPLNTGSTDGPPAQ